MRRDNELIREIILHIEKEADNPHDHVSLEYFAETDQKKLHYHLWLLLEGGYITGNDASTFDGLEIMPGSLTPKGHDFANSVRDSTIWKTTKEMAGKTGGATLSLVAEIAKELIKKSVIG